MKAIVSLSQCGTARVQGNGWTGKTVSPLEVAFSGPCFLGWDVYTSAAKVEEGPERSIRITDASGSQMVIRVIPAFQSRSLPILVRDETLDASAWGETPDEPKAIGSLRLSALIRAIKDLKHIWSQSSHGEVLLAPERVVATDSVRLSLLPLAGMTEKTVCLAQPILDAIEFIRHASFHETVQVFSTFDKTILESGNTRVVIDGNDITFPSYESILPKSHSLTMTADPRALKTLFEKCSRAATDSKKKADVEILGGRLSAVVGIDGADFRARVECDTSFLPGVEPRAVYTAFNSAFMVDALNLLGDTNTPVTLGMGTSKGGSWGSYPCTLANESGRVTILMPITGDPQRSAVFDDCPLLVVPQDRPKARKYPVVPQGTNEGRIVELEKRIVELEKRISELEKKNAEQEAWIELVREGWKVQA